MRAAALGKLTLIVSLVSVLVGCTSLLNPRNVTPPPLKPDSASQDNFQALSTQLGDSCSAPILEPERSALIQEALADSHLQAVKAQLERRGFAMNVDEAQAVQLVGGEQLLIPFGQDAHLVWTRANGQTVAVGLIRQGNKTLNVGGDGQERVVRFLSAQQTEKLLRKLREKSKFQDFEGKLHQKGKRIGKVRVLFDETNKIAILGIAAEGNEEKIGHQVRIKVKADREDEPEDDAEPAIQATACGQASGEAVPTGAKMQPLALPPGEGDFEGGYEGPQICTSQWGYDYLCLSRTPSVSLSTTSLALPQTFINQQVQGSFVVWNGGGGTLTGTVSVPAPFSIVSGGSFSLLPGQPQEVVVRFSSGTAGSFSKSISISSNGGNATVTATGVAHKVSFSPAPLDFGSGLLVMREQCNDMGVCGLHTEKVGLPIEKPLTVKNEGTVAVSLTLSTSAPYKLVSVLPTLSPGQSAQVTLRFDPTESGSFTGTVQVGINGGQGSVSSPPLVGVAHKIEIDPAELNFGLVFVGGTAERKLTVKNQGVTTVALAVSVNEPFSMGSESSFTLAPSESREVAIQISPTASESLSGNVQVASGLVSFKVPLRAEAMTYEEYLQTLLTTANALARYGNYNVGIAESWQNSCLHTFAGFDNLSDELIRGYMDGTDCEEGAPDIDLARLEELKRASELVDIVDIERLNTWLRTLKQALVEGRFDEEYERLLPEGLDQFMEAFRLILGLSNIRANELKTWLKGFLQVLDQQNPVDYAKERQAAARAFLVKTYGENHYFVQFFDQRIVPLWDQVIRDLGATPPSFGDERNNFSRAMYWIIVRCDACFNSLVNVLAAMNTEATITQNLGTILSIGHAAYQGWLVKEFVWVDSSITRTGVWAARLTLPYDKANALGLGQLFGQREGPGRVYEIKGIQAIVIGNHCDQCANWGGQIAEWVFEALKRYGFGFTTGGSDPGRGNLNVVVISFTRNNAQGIEGPGGVIEQLSTDPWIASSGAVVMIVYIKDGQVQWACISRGCNYLTDEEKEAIAKSFANLLSKYPSGMIETLMGFCGGDASCVINILRAGR